MWNLEKDPHLASAFANVTILDRPPDLDRLRARLLDGQPGRSPACASGWRRCSAASPRPSGWTTPTSTSTTTSAASRCPRPGTERQLLRPGRPAGRRRRSTAAARCGSSPSSTACDGGRAAHAPEDAPHPHRRRGRRAPVGAVHRPRARPRSREPSPTPTRPTPTARRRGRPLPVAGRRPRWPTTSGARPASPGASPPASPARSPTPTGWPQLPGRRGRRRAARCPARRSCTGERRSPLWPSARSTRHFDVLRVPARRREAGGQGARRQRQRPVRRRRGRRRRRLPPGHGRRRRRAAHLDAGQHPVGHARPAATPSPRPGCSCRSGPRPERALRRDQRSGCRSPRRSGPSASPSCWPGWSTCCPRRCSSAWPRRRSRRSTSPPRTCGARRCRSTSPAPRSRATTRSARWPAPRSTSRRCRYNGSLDMGLHVDRAAIDDPELLRTCIEESFEELLAFG